MEPRYKNAIRRKLYKQTTANGNGPSSEDVIADFAYEQLIGVATEMIDRKIKSPELLKCISLFAHNNKLLSLTTPFVHFDQVPLEAILQVDYLGSLLPKHHYHVLLCNLAINWVDAGQLISSIYQNLMPQGEFYVSAFGSNTASKFRSILAGLDNAGHFNVFFNIEEFGNVFSSAGFEAVMVESIDLSIEYQSVEVLLKDSRRIFGVNTASKRNRALTAKSCLKAFKHILQQELQKDGQIIENVEILIARGRKQKGKLTGAYIPVSM